MFATASLVCGLAAIAWPHFITALGAGIAAIFFGGLGVKSERRGLAVSGIVLGALGLVAFGGFVYLERNTQRSIDKLLDNMYEPARAKEEATR